MTEDHETVAYRIKSLKNTTTSLTALLTFVIGITLSMIAFMIKPDALAHYATIAIILFLYGMATLQLLTTKANRTDGLARDILSRMLDFPDPPLDEWEESLEERGKFTDMGEIDE